MTELKCLTTREVACLCRVSDATVKRWDDAGLLKSERTRGRHRRFRAEEVVRFQREQGLGLKQTHADASVIKSKFHRNENKTHSDSAFFNSLIAGCEESAANTLITAHLHGKTLTEIFEEFVCSSMCLIGELWYDGEISITQEHLATRAVCSAIYKLRNALPVPEMTNQLAICCAVEGDYHELPTHLAQMTIENEGWEVINFGANTPLYCLADEVLQHSPDAVCISAAIINDLERLSRDYKNFCEHISKLKVPILLGGKVFEEERIRRRFPAEIHAQSFAEAAEFTRHLT